MNCQRNVNSVLPTQLPHKFSYMVAILIHTIILNHPIVPTLRSKSLSIKWAMTVETNAVGLQHIWRIFK
jgi:hypothetical protein